MSGLNNSGRETVKPWIPLVTAVAFAASLAVTAQDSTGINIGTWNLNVAKSKYDPGPAPKSDTRTYEQTPKGVHLTAHLVASDGTSQDSASTYKYDGKPYAITGYANFDTVKVTRTNSRAVRVTQLLGSKVVGHLTIAVSADGKTMTMTQTLTTALGQSQHNVLVYDRQ
jgi:hypothetical protein